MPDDLAIVLDPLLPLPWLAGLAGAAVLAVAAAGLRRARGTGLRFLALASLLVALANPSWIGEQRERLPDVGFIVVDATDSQTLTDRAAAAEEARAALQDASADHAELALRTVRVTSTDGPQGRESALMAALADAAADVPTHRRAGAVLITDGRIHDLDAAPEGMGPIHALITGDPEARDRRLTIEAAPSYAQVGEAAEIRLRVDDLPADSDTPIQVPLTVRVDGAVQQRPAVPLGQPVTIRVPIEQPGRSVIDLAVPARDGQISGITNRAAVAVNGVRDRLRVLLVSGEPHMGERTWRQLLKADPGVALIHFTILRPPAKRDETPLDELALIAFPVRELFEQRLDEFDLVIFDRYRRRGVLPATYFQNIVSYVQDGGALLEASGPSFARATSLYHTPLQSLLPAEPTGEVAEERVMPTLTELGRRHPVTAALTDGAATGDWGPWLRRVTARQRRGTAVMTDGGEAPLVLLDQVGDGRVAHVLSDQMWLWRRGYQGGGPQGELLRRTAHWLMQEPELAANALRAEAEEGRLTAVQRRLRGEPGAVTVTGPNGEERDLTMTETAPGRWEGQAQVTTPGLYRLRDDAHTTVVAVGALDPPELRDLRASAEPLTPVAEATGGRVLWHARSGIPELRHLSGRSRYHGDSATGPWLAWRANDASRVTGMTEVPVVPAWLMLVLSLALVLGAWLRESR